MEERRVAWREEGRLCINKRRVIRGMEEGEPAHPKGRYVYQLYIS
jgi:hypothetical protein